MAAKNLNYSALSSLYLFDAVEVHPCVEEYDEETNDSIVYQVDESEAIPPECFWSVYLHYNPSDPRNEGFGGLECVADFDTKDEAEEYAVKLRLVANL